jgi:hypothetical protein
LTIRTPFFIRPIARASMMLRVPSVSGVCRVMMSAGEISSGSSTFSTPRSSARVRQERVVGDHLHLQAERTVGHDGADVAAADHPERLAEQLGAHEAVLLPLPGLG